MVNSMIQAYKKQKVLGASQAVIVSMLLEKAALHVDTALKALAEKDYEACFFATEQAHIILFELRICLDGGIKGSEVFVKSMQQWYDCQLSLINRINVFKDEKSGKIVISSLKKMAAGWREIDKKVKEEQFAVNPLPSYEATAIA